jgi:hypothetical protein
MRKTPKHINYELISGFVGLFGGIFLLYYCINFARNTCDFLFGYRTTPLILLFYFIWLAIIILPTMIIHYKLKDYFDELNYKWETEWWKTQKTNN